VLTHIDLRDAPSGDLRGVLPRAAVDVESALHAIRPIVAAVRDHGGVGVRDATRRLDQVELERVRVPAAELAVALGRLDPAVRAALTESVRRARIVHEAQRPDDVTVRVVPGGTVTERWLPIARVGLYIPGGLAAYPSSVVMNVVPAQVAGVGSLALASAPKREFGGLPHPAILAACALLGVDEVYAVGGAQAIAMFAYGLAESTMAAGEPAVAPVDLVTGPGNIYVAAAKRMLRGLVGIDAEAGPTEIAVLADDTADPAHVAADLISQAEHDTLAASVLITDSDALVAAVEAELVTQVAATKHAERVTAALTGPQSGVVLVRDLDQGLAVADAYAAEHLEVITRNPRAVADRVRNAGCVFVGPDSPVSLGDYCAGSNHVLPTGCTARHASGLSVGSFLKRVHLVEYDRAALAGVADHVIALATAENLPAHAAAVQIRTGR
jgi:histidinol dehydrogenase